MEKFYLRAVRITVKQKLADRWTHSQWYQPLDAEDAGTTFVLIEVVNPWFPSPQVTTTITNTFNREYFRGRRVSSTTDSFEAAVRRVNEALAARAEEGETDWIGNLNAVLAVVSGNELHFVQAGNARGFIVRSGAANPINEPRPLGEPPTPLATFGSIVTGTLEPGDKGLFSTPDLPEYVQPPQLVTALEKPVEAAAKEIVRILQTQRVKTPHAILFDFSATPHPERREDESDTIFLDVPLVGGLTRAKHVAKNVIVPTISSGVKATGSAASWFWGKTRSDVFPKVKSGISRLASRGKEGVSTAAEKAAPVVSSVTSSAQNVLSDAASKAEGMDKKSLITKPVGALAGLLSSLTRLAQSVRLRSRLLFVGATIVVLAVIGLRVATMQRERTGHVEKKGAQEALTAAQAKKQEADLALIAQENDKAVTLLVEALDLAKKAAAHPEVASTAQEVTAGAQKSLDTLTKTERVSEKSPSARFVSPVKIAVIDDAAWAVDGDGKVTASPATGEAKESKPISGLSTIVGLGHIKDHQILYLVGSSGIGMVRTQDLSASSLTPPEGGWQSAVAVKSYGTNLYFLDPSAGQIWKYASSREGTLGPATKYFAESQTISSAIDLAIDGNIYVLFPDGTVNRHFKGAAETFALTGLPKPYEKFVKPTMIATDSEATGLFVYESSDKRVVEFDKKGAYKRQFALPANWEVKDLVTGAKKMFVLAGNEVYEISL